MRATGELQTVAGGQNFMIFGESFQEKSKVDYKENVEISFFIFILFFGVFE